MKFVSNSLSEGRRHQFVNKFSVRDELLGCQCHVPGGGERRLENQWLGRSSCRNVSDTAARKEPRIHTERGLLPVGIACPQICLHRTSQVTQASPIEKANVKVIIQIKIHPILAIGYRHSLCFALLLFLSAKNIAFQHTMNLTRN
jgi:hypothetical protein